jgi:hypothetical protein
MLAFDERQNGLQAEEPTAANVTGLADANGAYLPFGRPLVELGAGTIAVKFQPALWPTDPDGKRALALMAQSRTGGAFSENVLGHAPTLAHGG